MPIGFLNPALLLGLLGAGMPLLVHLLGRRHARSRPFAALEFLIQSERRLAARRRVRHLLLLFARIALVCAVALAIARPLFRGGTVAGSGQPVSVIAVIDRTASMRVRVDGETAFERARERLLESLEALPSGSEANVITIESTPRRLTRGWVSVDRAMAELRRLDPGWSSGTLDAALSEVIAVRGSARRATSLILIASDLQVGTWARAGVDLPQLRGSQVVIIDAVGGAYPDDVGLTDAELVDDVEAVTLRVARSATDDASVAPSEQIVELSVAGELVNRGVVTVSPGASVATQLALQLAPTSSRGAVAEVRVTAGGSFEGNDRRFVYLEPPRAVRVLLADGSPNADLHQDEVFYLERALRASGADVTVTVADVSGGAVPTLVDFDVVVVANSGPLDGRSRRAIAQHVEDGGGLLVTVGDNVTAASLAADLGPLSPGVVRSVAQGVARPLAIDLSRSDGPSHPVIAPFDSSAAARSLTAARFSRVLEVDATPDASVLLRYGGGLPALIEARRGQGRVMLWTSTVDRGWNDIAVKPAFLPLVGRIVRHLGGALDQPRVRTFAVQEEVRVAVESGRARPVTAIRFATPDRGWLESARVESGVAVVPEGAAQPGVYEAHVGGQRAPDYDFVVNLSASESVLERITSEQIDAQLGVDAEVTAGDELDAHREDEAVVSLLVIIALALLAEALLGRPKSAILEGA